MIVKKDKTKKSKIINKDREKIIFDKSNNKTKKDNIGLLSSNQDLIMAKDSIKVTNDSLNNEKNNINSTKKKINKDYKDESKHKTKRLFFGLGKEFWRISWPSNKKIVNDFITVIIVMAFLVLLFWGIGLLIATFIN